MPSIEQTWNTVEGSWRELKGEAQRTWGKLTDDDLNRVKGRHEELVGTLQRLYGWSEAKARAQAAQFAHRIWRARDQGTPDVH